MDKRKERQGITTHLVRDTSTGDVWRAQVVEAEYAALRGKSLGDTLSPSRYVGKDAKVHDLASFVDEQYGMALLASDAAPAPASDAAPAPASDTPSRQRRR